MSRRRRLTNLLLPLCPSIIRRLTPPAAGRIGTRCRGVALLLLLHPALLWWLLLRLMKDRSIESQGVQAPRQRPDLCCRSCWRSGHRRLHCRRLLLLLLAEQLRRQRLCLLRGLGEQDGIKALAAPGGLPVLCEALDHLSSLGGRQGGVLPPRHRSLQAQLHRQLQAQRQQADGPAPLLLLLLQLQLAGNLHPVPPLRHVKVAAVDHHAVPR